MTKIGAPREKKAGKKMIKGAVFLLLVVGAGVVFRYTPLRSYLDSETLGNLLDGTGGWAPVVFILVYAVAICLFIPGTILTGLGAAIFGAGWGFVYVWCGAMLGAALAFAISRWLGREWIQSLVGDRFRRFDDAVARNGFATVLYLRLVYVPFTAMNFGMGLTRVRFWDYMAGTGLGILVGTFVLTFLVGTLKEVWASGDWGRLLSLRVGFSVCLFVGSFFIPKILKRLKNRFARLRTLPLDAAGEETG